MTANITVAVPLGAIAAIRSGFGDSIEVADAIKATNKALMDAIKDGRPHTESLPKSTTLEVHRSTNIFVTCPGGSRRSFIVNSSHTVNDLKGCVYGSAPWPPTWRLTYKGVPMDDGDILLSYHGLEDGDTIRATSFGEARLPRRTAMEPIQELASESRNVTVRFLGPGSHSVSVSSSHTIDDLKTYLAGPTPWPPDQQRLICKGRQLEDGKTFSDYKIEDGACIYLVNRLRGS